MENRQLFAKENSKKMFDAHTPGDAKVTTDQWRGYRPLIGKIRYRNSSPARGPNSRPSTPIHQIKSWIRTYLSWAGKRCPTLDRYFDEFWLQVEPFQNKKTNIQQLIVRCKGGKNYITKQIMQLTT